MNQHPRRILNLPLVVACLLSFFGSPLTHAAEILPRVPKGAQTLFAETATIPPEGQAWLVETTLGKSVHLNGASAIMFDFSSLKLAAGHYRFGFIIRTGTHWKDANGQLSNYRWRLLPASGEPTAPASLTALENTAFKPVRESGLQDAWANWYGAVQASAYRPSMATRRLSSPIWTTIVESPFCEYNPSPR